MPRVLIAEKEILLGAAIQSFLAGKPGLDVISIPTRDLAELVQEIERVQPDVVILGEPGHLSEPAQLLTYLRGYPKLRVVVVSAENNMVRVYDRHEVSLKRAAQILDVLHDDGNLSSEQ